MGGHVPVTSTARRHPDVLRTAAGGRRPDDRGDRAAADRFLASDRAVVLAVGERGLGGPTSCGAATAGSCRSYATSGSTRRRSCCSSSGGSSSTRVDAGAELGVARERMVERALARGRRSAASKRRWCAGSRSTATAWPWWSGRPGPARRSRSPPRARRGRRAATRCSASAVARRAARELEHERRDREHERRRAARASSTRRPSGAAASVRAGGRRGRHGPDAAARRARRRTRSRSRGKLVLVGDHRQLPEHRGRRRVPRRSSRGCR